MSQKITTKCICIIRHKKGNKKPKIYEVKIQSRGEKGEFLYNFIKKGEPIEKVAEFISERNNEIAEKKIVNEVEKYFLIIEYEIPFFKGKFEKYADLFEFMDVPGLNESNDKQKSVNSEKKDENTEKDENEKNKEKEKENNSIEDNFYFRNIFPFIQMNIAYSLFIFDVQGGYEKKNAQEILKKYIGKIENSIYNKELKNFKGSNYGDRMVNRNDEMNKQRKEEQRYYNSLKSFKNSIFVLNKIDTIQKKEDRKKINEKFREKMVEIVKQLTDGKINKDYPFYLNNDNEIGINGKELNERISKYDSFEKYLSYYINNSKEFDDNNYNFFKYIVDKMNKDFSLDIKIKEYEDEDSDDENEK